MDKKNNQSAPLGGVVVTQDMVIPGSVKPRHLQPQPLSMGDLYYSDGTNFIRLGIGKIGQVLLVSNGIPAWASFPQTGTAANRPTSGRFTGDQYFATDSLALSVWTGSVWKSVTLS